MYLKLISVGYRLNVLIPTILEFFDVVSKSSHNGFDERFYLPVTLRTILCDKVVTNRREVAHRFKEIRGKVPTIVGQQLAGAPVAVHPVIY